MQLRLSPRRRLEGSILPVALCITTLIGLTLATYLRLMVNQNQLTARSQVWNACIPVVEAGIEEGLTHCTHNSTNLASNGWALSAGRYRLTNTVGVGYYHVSIGTDVPYEVTSTGYYPMNGSSSYISRTVQVTTQMDPLLVGIVARLSVTMVANPAAIDSFDSRDPAKSTDGQYDRAKYRGDKADVSCLTVGGFIIRNGNIWGRAAVPSGGSVDCGANGAVGSAAWNGSRRGIQPGWLRTDLNQTMPDVTVPFTAGIPPASGLVNGVFYRYVLNGGNFVVPELDDEDVAVTAPSSLYVVGDADFGDLMIKSNATFKIYVGGSDADFDDIDNQNQTSPTLILYGLPAMTGLSLGSDWAGGVYAPNAHMEGDGLSGAAMVKSFRLNGNNKFHYDEAFNTTNNVRAWVVNSWREQ